MIELFTTILRRNKDPPSPGRGGGVRRRHNCQNWPEVPRQSVARPGAGRLGFQRFDSRCASAGLIQKSQTHYKENIDIVVPQSRKRQSHRMSRQSDRPSRGECFRGRGRGCRKWPDAVCCSLFKRLTGRRSPSSGGAAGRQSRPEPGPPLASGRARSREYLLWSGGARHPLAFCSHHVAGFHRDSPPGH